MGVSAERLRAGWGLGGNTRHLVDWESWKTRLEVHSVERIYLRQRCFDAAKPRVAAATGGE